MDTGNDPAKCPGGYRFILSGKLREVIDGKPFFQHTGIHISIHTFLQNKSQVVVVIVRHFQPELQLIAGVQHRPSDIFTHPRQLQHQVGPGASQQPPE